MRGLHVLLVSLASIGSLVAACSLSACAVPDDGGSDTASSEDAVTSLDPGGAQPVAITEPAALRALEARGYGFGHHFGIADDVRADDLASTSSWASIARGIEGNLAALKTEDPSLGVGMNHEHRMFDAAWLRSHRSRFTLVAVTNRLDRASGAGDCGEVRFVYRLAYDDTREIAPARLPMTVAVVVPQLARAPEQGCSRIAMRWQSLAGKTGVALAAAATSGPLASLPAATSIETNLQAVRWPSSVRKDLGGEAEYMLSVWRPTSGSHGAAGTVTYEAGALENTPDVDAIQRDPAKKHALVAWMKSNVSAIDRGISKLPRELAAHTAYSYGPRGLSRLANRPFAALVDARELDGAPFAGTQLVASAAGLLRRLDEQSCQGCHQARGIAGFHVLGNDDDDSRTDQLDRLTVGTSPHFAEELAWRMRVLRAAAAGGDPSSPTEARTFAEHATSDGLVGQSCGLGDDRTFTRWTCRDGLMCKDMIGDGVVGTCQPSSGPRAGDACEKDRIASSIDPHADTVTNLDPGDAACRRWRPEATCSGAAGGFPGGSCTALCTKLGEVTGDTICGTAPPGGFNECMIAHEKSFQDCMSPPRLGLRRACSVTSPCRDDYACAHVPGAPAGIGACMPPYFVFQARVDGHE